MFKKSVLVILIILFVLILANVSISLIRNLIPNRIRIIVQFFSLKTWYFRLTLLNTYSNTGKRQVLCKLVFSGLAWFRAITFQKQDPHFSMCPLQGHPMFLLMYQDCLNLVSWTRFGWRSGCDSVPHYCMVSCIY